MYFRENLKNRGENKKAALENLEADRKISELSVLIKKTVKRKEKKKLAKVNHCNWNERNLSN